MNDVEATPVYHRIKSGDTLGAIAKDTVLPLVNFAN